MFYNNLKVGSTHAEKECTIARPLTKVILFIEITSSSISGLDNSVVKLIIFLNKLHIFSRSHKG